MTVTLPRSLSTRSQLAKQSRQQILQTIIQKAVDHPDWSHREMATWIAHEYGVAVPTGYAWLARARVQLQGLNQIAEGDVPSPVTEVVPVNPGQVHP